MKKWLLATMLSVGLSMPIQNASLAESFSNSKVESELTIPYFFNFDKEKSLRPGEGVVKSGYYNLYLGDNVSDSVRRNTLFSNEKIDSVLNNFYFRNYVPKEITKIFMKKVVNQESSRQIYAYNKKSGARGVGQFMKPAWEEVDSIVPYHEGVYDPVRSLENSVKYYSWLSKFNKNNNPYWKGLHNWEKQMYLGASYNWGPGAVQRNNFILDNAPDETQGYMENIVSSY
ncbi:lytic transglycosylase domain-containing protein [archaeon]|jgi:hypothetical protein|nr:lytic transglycosylase domain-containing protein [archaeon]